MLVNLHTMTRPTNQQPAVSAVPSADTVATAPVSTSAPPPENRTLYMLAAAQAQLRPLATESSGCIDVVP